VLDDEFISSKGEDIESKLLSDWKAGKEGHDLVYSSLSSMDGDVRGSGIIVDTEAKLSVTPRK